MSYKKKKTNSEKKKKLKAKKIIIAINSQKFNSWMNIKQDK